MKAKNQDQIQFAIGKCSLGCVLVANNERGVCAILMGSASQALTVELRARFPEADLATDRSLQPLLEQVVSFIEAPQKGLRLPLDARGTEFQRRVWSALRKIPVGSTASYTDIARRIGAPKSVRAVAGACAANPVALAIPCHRVVRNDGGLSGYRWGVKRKQALLDREASAAL